MASNFRLSGAINPKGCYPAIYVPVFGCVTDNHSYTQHIGIDDRTLSFEFADLDVFEPVKSTAKSRDLTEGDPAIYSVAWSGKPGDEIFDSIEVIRKNIIENRWIVEKIENPFERLDFAQLSGHDGWFADEALACQAVFDEEGRRFWLKETLCLSRVRFAVDSALFSANVPIATRRRFALRVEGEDNNEILKRVKILCQEIGQDRSHDAIVSGIKRFLNRDVAYRYAIKALNGSANVQPEDASPVKWFKQITASDAQRKKSGNQRGSITLVKGPLKVDAQTYFRQHLFSSLDWVSGKKRNSNKKVETASVRMDTKLFDRELGFLSYSVSHEPGRAADQGNYTTALHVGPLSQVFATEDFTDKWIAIERKADNSFALSITDKRPD